MVMMSWSIVYFWLSEFNVTIVLSLILEVKKIL